jgi:hypothetical protein
MPRPPSRGFLVLAVFVAACVPYLPTIDDYFTQDDFGVVQLLASKPWSTFPRWFTMPWMEGIWGYTPDEIRPFVAFTYQLTAIPGAARPELHHLFNILLHGANALLVMALARRAGGLPRGAAAAAALVFAVLPVQAESVAWITGRVDSMPAFFYFATVLAYVRWRRGDGAPWYGAALALFFVALFSKQNTITMVASLAAYDVLVLAPPRKPSWVRLPLAWIPFTAMTLGYLVLRRFLFGASVRGGVASPAQLALALDTIERHLLRTVFGGIGPLAAWQLAAAGALVCVLVAVLWRRRELLGPFACFGVGWWILGALPVIVAGYESPRHVYLASAGWAFVVGLAFAALQQAAERAAPRLRVVPNLLMIALLGGYLVQLGQVVLRWGEWARVSRTAVERVAAEAAAAPRGTLLLVSVPEGSWAWASPFVLRPPYAPADLTGRVHLVTPMRLDCCSPSLWDSTTRARLRAWRADGRAGVVALHVAPSTGAVSRVTDADRPELRSIAAAFGETDSWQALDRAVIGLMERVVRR